MEKKDDLNWLRVARQTAASYGDVGALQVVNQLIADYARRHKVDYYSL